MQLQFLVNYQDLCRSVVFPRCTWLCQILTSTSKQQQSQCLHVSRSCEGRRRMHWSAATDHKHTHIDDAATPSTAGEKCCGFLNKTSIILTCGDGTVRGAASPPGFVAISFASSGGITAAWASCPSIPFLNMVVFKNFNVGFMEGAASL